MTAIKQVYKCSICGNMVEVIHAGAGTLVCCGKNMDLLVEKDEDNGFEKHVPVIEKSGDELLVKVGSVEHPMEEKHYIEWIELHTQSSVFRRYLKPGEKPEARFKPIEGVQYAREYCSIHGMWKSK